MASHRVDWQDEFPQGCRAGATAIGNFDGVHRGHAELVRALLRQARKVSGPAVAVTFDPHPLDLLRPGIRLDRLTEPEDRAAYLHELGVDHVLTIRTVPSLLELPAAAFFEQVILGRLQARAMAEGTNFHFGHGREGNIGLLRRLCEQHGVDLEVVQPVLVSGAEASSSRIRALLAAGDVRGAAELLGRAYRVRGRVETGQRRGGPIGFPTANLGRVETVIPRDGVYAVRAETAAGEVWPGAANVGGNPTFGEHERKIEVHLIGFAGDLYGQEMGVAFVERLRDTQPFANVQALQTQLRHDVQNALAVVR